LTTAVRLAAAVALLAAATLTLLFAAPGVPRVTWDDLIAPLGVGQPVARGYVLAPPRRGNAHDVVYSARRAAGPTGPAGLVEVHIIPRGQWKDIPETRSFGVAWEVPPQGSMVVASPDDARAVRDALVDAIARNDSGFASVDAVPLATDPQPSSIVSILTRLSGARGVVIGLAVALALIALGSVPYGAVAVGVLLFALGLALRLPALDLPFAHDQDVQRLFTGYLPLREILTGAGLADRHPPLYFVVLHFVEHFGQSEAVTRAPAVVAGALVGPAILLATASMRGWIGPVAVLTALAVTVSPELVTASREVSEIPLFALMVIAAAASLVASLRELRPRRLAMLAASHALIFYTYYLAPAVAAAHAVILAAAHDVDRRVARAFVAGILAGIPALVLGFVTLFRDWGARETARAFPAVAWGQHTPGQMATLMVRIAVDTLGVPLLILLMIAIAVGIRRRDPAVIVPAAGAAATCAAIALLSPIARVQGYYITTVLPLAALALAAAPGPRAARYRAAWVGAVVLAVSLSTVPLLAGARSLYVRNPDAFMPDFARAIAQRPEHTVVAIAHYDKTLVAYYLARGTGHPVGWNMMDEVDGKRIEGLVMVHELGAESEQTALRRLDQLAAAEPILVIERDAFLLPTLVERLSTCELLLQAPTARLLRCAPPDHRAEAGSIRAEQ